MRMRCLLRVMYEPWFVLICRFDFLRITNEINKEFATLCGTRTSYWPLKVTRTKVVLTFHSDNKNQRKGFRIHFRAVGLKGM